MYIDTSNVQSLKEKLLLCAVNEFAEYGYEGARVDNIVKAAGCSKQTVYHHFGNKENLFIEVLEYTWNDIRQKEKALDFSDLPPQKAIEKIIDFTWDYYIANPGNDSNLLIVFYVQIMPDDLVMQLHRF